MIRVKCTAPDLPFIAQTDNGCWGDCVFFWNDPNVKECDYWFVFDYWDAYGLAKDNVAVCPRENVYLIMLEADEYKTYNRDYVKQFYNIITVQRDRYDVPRVIYKFLANWYVGLRFVNGKVENKHYKSFKALSDLGTNIEKTKLLSIISSNKQMNEGHRQRLQFAAMVKQCFGDQVDFFGKGINEFADKWDVLAPYKYHIAIENQVCDDYITEKFYDPLLAMSYPIYHGAGNIGKYFDKRSFASIDIYQPEKAIRTIQSVINGNSYEYFHQHLIEARELALKKYNVFNEIWEIIRDDPNPHSAPEKHCIYSECEIMGQVERGMRKNVENSSAAEISAAPKVTIGIPTFNRKDYLKKTLDSVIGQDYPNIEIIVSDNASSDGTEEVVRSYCRQYDNIVYYRYPQNMGFRLNWKNCLDLATGKYCLLLSDDDILEDGAIKRMVDSFVDEVVVVVGNTIHIDANDNVVGGHSNPPGILNERAFWEARLTKWYHDTPSGAMYLTKNGREAFNKVSEKAGTALDIAMDLVMSRQGNIWCIPDIVVKYRVHEDKVRISNKLMEVALSHIGMYEVLKDVALNNQCRDMLHYYCQRTIYEHVWKAVEAHQVETANQCLELLNALKR